MAAKSRQELYEIIKNEVQVGRPELTDWEEGSILDIMTGAISTAISEAIDLTVIEFRKTLIDGANGPEVTGGADDLETLAVDHFGDEAARPEATKAVGIVTFSRANTSAGNVTIPSGTVVKTATDSNGQSQRFQTVAEVTLTGLTISASVEAIEAGTKGNVQIGKVTVIESTLTDPSITVTNAAAFSGGAPVEDDSTYRQTIRNFIQQLKGATAAAIKAKALSVAGIVHAQTVEEAQTVIEWNPSLEVPIGDYFTIPRAKLYIADVNGEANGALVDLVESAVLQVRACGVKIDVVAAIAATLNWTASITLNPGGPNYATLQTDTTMIEETMAAYLNSLPVGSGFDRLVASAAMLAIWGPAGSNDISAFTTSTPTGNIAPVTGTKIIPGTMSI